MTPMERGVLSSRFSLLTLHLLEKFADAYDCAAYRALPDLLDVITCGHAHGVETSVKRFECGRGLDVGANTACSAVLHVNRGADCDLIAFAVGLERVESSDLHQADHVRRGINGRDSPTTRPPRF